MTDSRAEALRPEGLSQPAAQEHSALRIHAELFRLLVEAVQDYAIFMLDPDGRVATWNLGAERIKGYKASEIIGQHFSIFYSEEDQASGKPARELVIAIREGRVEDEGWRLRKDGSPFWACVTITALHDAAGKLVGFGKVTRDFTERMQAEKALQNEVRERTDAQLKLSNSEASLRRLSLHLLHSQDEERRRIGRDLHDSLGQYLSVLKMKLDSAARALGPEHQLFQTDIEECANLADESIRELRTIAYLLFPPMLEEMGLKSAILWYLEGFSKRSGIQISLDVAPDFSRLHRDAELALFRVLQEGLANVHRHSGSPSADIHLRVADGKALLEIVDQGQGMPQADMEQLGRDWTGSLGVGIRGMIERMRQLGGDLELFSSTEGTRVRASIPLAPVSNDGESAGPEEEKDVHDA